MTLNGLELLYKVREALGFNDKYPLSGIVDDVRQQRAALLAAAPIVALVIAEERKNAIGNSDLDDEQPVTLTIRTKIGTVRRARLALLVAAVDAVGGE